MRRCTLTIDDRALGERAISLELTVEWPDPENPRERSIALTYLAEYDGVDFAEVKGQPARDAFLAEHGAWVDELVDEELERLAERADEEREDRRGRR